MAVLTTVSAAEPSRVQTQEGVWAVGDFTLKPQLLFCSFAPG